MNASWQLAFEWIYYWITLQLFKNKLSWQALSPLQKKKKDNDKLPRWIKVKTLSPPKYQQLYIIHVWEEKIIIAHIEMSVYDDKASS